jgi:hypothetical protein
VNKYCVSDVLARGLLLANGWNLDKVEKSFLAAKGGVEEIFKFKFAEKLTNSDLEVTCDICYFEVDQSEMVRIGDCGHGACKECYYEYLISKLNEGTSAVKATCTEASCHLVVP